MSDTKPITDELRKYATVSWDPWPDARDRLYQMCDRIDAIHAGLERENEALRERMAKMDNVGESMHGCITHELREWANTFSDMLEDHEKALAIADRIDAEHERAVMSAMNDALYHANDESMAELGWVRLPKDENGEPICIGDSLKDGAEFKSEGVVECLMLDESGWFVGFGNGWTDVKIHEWHHHHAPTVEDVLREFADGIKDQNADFTELAIAEYAAKLRLAGDAS